MKRHSIFSWPCTASCAIMLALSIGCKSSPVQNVKKVNPLDLLDNESGFYIRIPTATDLDLVEALLQKYADGLSAEDAETAARQIDTVYAGFNRSMNSTDFQIAADGFIPRPAVKKIFSAKNGWSKENLLVAAPSGKKASYAVYSRRGLCAAFPSEQVACLGRDVPWMLGQYQAAPSRLEGAPVLDGKIYGWLSAAEADIRFFAARPASFLSTLTGASLNFRLAYARGILAKSGEADGRYVLNLEFEFQDHRTVSAAKGALSVAFGLTDSNIAQNSATHLSVSNINIRKEQFRAMLAL